MSALGTPAVLAASVPINTSTTSTSGGSPDVLINPVQGPSAQQELKTRTKSAWPWYITRAAGLMAAILLVLLILSGVGLITGYTFKFLEPLTAWATHRALGLAFGLAILIHALALLFDHYVPFTIVQVLVPFMSSYRNLTLDGYHLGSLYVAFGIFAAYCILAIIISSLLWIDKKPYLWKIFHFLAYLVMIFVFIHALYLGTDLAHGIFRVLWIIFGVVTALAILYRLSRAQST
ncbi:MAG TPA: hypothetical protein VNE40_03775 [Candidatus Dormibacteraeota bacterium]|nr:hypothetical protein [Candidatus Dormibacteraeota bacterium]